MENSTLDIWAIQKDPAELNLALSKIKDGVNIIYSNCICDFQLGNNKIRNRKFDTILYNEQSDLLIFLMQDGKVNKDIIIAYLEKMGKTYGEVRFSPLIETYENDDQFPEVWFARDIEVVKDALKDSSEKTVSKVEYYPEIEGKIQFSYLNNYHQKEPIDGRKIKGIIKTEEKIILLINSLDKEMFDIEKIKNCVDELEMIMQIALNNEFDLSKTQISK